MTSVLPSSESSPASIPNDKESFISDMVSFSKCFYKKHPVISFQTWFKWRGMGATITLCLLLIKEDFSKINLIDTARGEAGISQIFYTLPTRPLREGLPGEFPCIANSDACPCCPPSEARARYSMSVHVGTFMISCALD